MLGLANKKTVTIQPADNQSVLLATTKTKKQNKPSALLHKSVMKKEFRRMAKAVQNQVVISFLNSLYVALVMLILHVVVYDMIILVLIPESLVLLLSQMWLILLILSWLMVYYIKFFVMDQLVSRCWMNFAYVFYLFSNDTVWEACLFCFSIFFRCCTFKGVRWFIEICEIEWFVF